MRTQRLSDRLPVVCRIFTYQCAGQLDTKGDAHQVQLIMTQRATARALLHPTKLDKLNVHAPPSEQYSTLKAENNTKRKKTTNYKTRPKLSRRRPSQGRRRRQRRQSSSLLLCASSQEKVQKRRGVRFLRKREEINLPIFKLKAS